MSSPDAEIARRLEIGRIHRGHTRDEVYSVLESGYLDPDDSTTALSPLDVFTYRWHIAYGRTDGIQDLERFMLSMYGKDYLDAPELLENYYHDVELRAQSVGQIALFANLHTTSGLSAVTVGFLGNTAAYPPHVRRDAQSANFNNTLGLSGLTRVKLKTYQRIVTDQDGQVDTMRSILANTTRWYPFVVENIKLRNDLRMVVERKHMHVGEIEIKAWAEAHPTWKTWIEGTVLAVQNGVTNPIAEYTIPENYATPESIADMRDLRSFELLQAFERDDDL